MFSTLAKLGVFLALFLAMGVGYLIGTSPVGVTLPQLPPGSPAAEIPPWPIFRAAVALNGFFDSATRTTNPPMVQVMNLASAYWQSEVLYALTKHGVFDALKTLGGEANCVDVAKTLKLHQANTCRYMHAGLALGLLQATGEKDLEAFKVTPTGALLQKDAPGSMRAFTLMINEETSTAWRAAGLKSMKSGKSGFLEAFGEEFWSWHSKKPELMAQFNDAMTSLSIPAAGSILMDWQPPSENATFCDIGGGKGTVLSVILKHYPAMKGIVADLPQVMPQAKKFLEAQGVADRAQAVGGSFLEALPAELAQCDVLHLKHILHDWSDAQCITILKNVAKVAKKGATILTTDFVLGASHNSAMERAKRLMDINMLAANEAGACERTEAQFRALYKAAGITAVPTLIQTRDIYGLLKAQL